MTVHSGLLLLVLRRGEGPVYRGSLVVHYICIDYSANIDTAIDDNNLHSIWLRIYCWQTVIDCPERSV
jgi:hypothetical protein